jgi:hypothetical protein
MTRYCSSFWSWIHSFCRMCNFRSITMTQKCHEPMWKFTGKKLHTTRADLKVTEGLAECEPNYFYNLVIFSWLFKHKLRGGLAEN